MDRVDDPQTAARLVTQGSAERDSAGEPALTSLGEDGSGHVRATLDPALSRKRAEHLATMLNRIAADDTDDGWRARRHSARTMFLLVLPPMLAGQLADDIFGT